MADERTGLMWHRAASSVPVTLSDAQMECELSTVGGYADWRVPTFIELLSIVDHGITNPAIDLNAFPGTPLETFWTASVRGTTERAIDFTTGRADGSATTAFVRCVRDLHCTDGSGQSAPDLVDVPGALGGSACYRAFAERDWQQWTPASPAVTVSCSTVHDHVTGLMWPRFVDGTALEHAGAITACDTLELDGHTDWRLPSRVELLSMVDHTVVGPAVDLNLFPATPLDRFWTSSRFGDEALFINFDDGRSNEAPLDSRELVRCVRAAPPSGPGTGIPQCVDPPDVDWAAWDVSQPPSLSAMANTVIDLHTGLQWTQHLGEMLDHAQATALCAMHDDAGGAGWRLPTRVELLSIVDPARTDPAISLVDFPDTLSDEYWTATPDARTQGDAWHINFMTGGSNTQAMTDTAAVRCVR